MILKLFNHTYFRDKYVKKKVVHKLIVGVNFITSPAKNLQNSVEKSKRGRIFVKRAFSKCIIQSDPTAHGNISST